MSGKPRLRCAIYTRKSSDDGLDQAFNSLDAQREAGEAYVKSQASEGWRAITNRYDDGGFSGGNMERPSLHRLMHDVDAGLIDVVVVYKIDRLTRSLADFARIVERFDARSVSFVSVTQSFNTTSSMGRLTLNVLLSFAQFEREVTGERIRDKIAASKAKGMWMGGAVPLGYDVPSQGSRALQVNETEAETVRHIFARYLALGSVHRLAGELADLCIGSKARITMAGRSIGGVPFSRGAVFHLLRNRLYLGQITHKGTFYEGQHQAIVTATLFEQVQALLASQTRRRAEHRSFTLTEARLTGRIFDQDGHLMTPTHTRGKTGKLYRYYVSAPLQQGMMRDVTAPHQRVPAPAIEALIKAAIARIAPQEVEPLDMLVRIAVHNDRLELQIRAGARALSGTPYEGGRLIRDPERAGLWRLTLALAFSRKGSGRTITSGTASRSRRDPVLIAALRRAHKMIGRDEAGPALVTAPGSQYGRRLAGLALLAPDIQRDILAGRQPQQLTLATLMARELPIDWVQQRLFFGFQGDVKRAE